MSSPTSSNPPLFRKRPLSFPSDVTRRSVARLQKKSPRNKRRERYKGAKQGKRNKVKIKRGKCLSAERGVAPVVPIERLSERVNIFLNTKHMHIPWGPMCVSYPDTSPAAVCVHTHRAQVGPPHMRTYARSILRLPEILDFTVASILPSRAMGKKVSNSLEAVTVWQLLLIVMWFSCDWRAVVCTIINDELPSMVRRKKFDSTLSLSLSFSLSSRCKSSMDNYRGLTVKMSREKGTNRIGFRGFQGLEDTAGIDALRSFACNSASRTWARPRGWIDSSDFLGESRQVRNSRRRSRRSTVFEESISFR